MIEQTLKALRTKLQSIEGLSVYLNEDWVNQAINPPLITLSLESFKPISIDSNEQQKTRIQIKLTLIDESLTNAASILENIYHTLNHQRLDTAQTSVITLSEVTRSKVEAINHLAVYQTMIKLEIHYPTTLKLEAQDDFRDNDHRLDQSFKELSTRHTEKPIDELENEPTH